MSLKQFLALCFLSITGAQAALPAQPVTITIKQTGMPSWKTFYKVPVSMSITNNQNHAIELMYPYIEKISWWSMPRIVEKVAQCMVYGGNAMTIVGSAATLLTPQVYECQIINTMHLCTQKTPSSILIILFGLFITSAGFIVDAVSTNSKSLGAHETITFSGYMNKADAVDMEKHQQAAEAASLDVSSHEIVNRLTEKLNGGFLS